MGGDVSREAIDTHERSHVRTDHTYGTHGAPRSKDNPLACIVSDNTPTNHPVITKETPVPPLSDLTDQGKTARCSRAYGGEGM